MRLAVALAWIVVCLVGCRDDGHEAGRVADAAAGRAAEPPPVGHIGGHRFCARSGQTAGASPAPTMSGDDPTYTGELERRQVRILRTDPLLVEHLDDLGVVSYDTTPSVARRLADFHFGDLVEIRVLRQILYSEDKVLLDKVFALTPQAAPRAARNASGVLLRRGDLSVYNDGEVRLYSGGTITIDDAEIGWLIDQLAAAGFDRLPSVDPADREPREILTLACARWQPVDVGPYRRELAPVLERLAGYRERLLAQRRPVLRCHEPRAFAWAMWPAEAPVRLLEIRRREPGPAMSTPVLPAIAEAADASESPYGPFILFSDGRWAYRLYWRRCARDAPCRPGTYGALQAEPALHLVRLGIVSPWPTDVGLDLAEIPPDEVPYDALVVPPEVLATAPWWWWWMERRIGAYEQDGMMCRAVLLELRVPPR